MNSVLTLIKYDLSKASFPRFVHFETSKSQRWRKITTAPEMETKSPPPCPSTVTVRRNPHRRARRATPSSNLPLSPNNAQIPSFPIDDILSIEITENPNPQPPAPPALSSSENLKVFLRIRPLNIQTNTKNRAEITETKNAWPKNPRGKNVKLGKPKAKEKRSSREVCITVNDSHSITLSPPQILQDTKRIKSEVYEGFEHVFSSESSQNEVYDKTVKPLVEDFLRGKSGMLAALGPSGSGKTHTVFGSVREPGMVPLALRRIFSSDEGKGTKSSRIFYLSMFEISSEKGKAEKIHDLLQEGGDLSMQQSTIKGLQEVLVHDSQHAEVLIESGMLKRATAMTNSNSQSSRSQCIINMRCEYKFDGEVSDQASSSILTIVDLAGAERERKTGNQGTRLLESNFINNTSMVFGLCLRSLLEHQKNPRKPLQKHFQSSMLTKYLRDYLEGKKRMTLVLTVRPGEEDYHDTSFLLRQASPYMQIKFNSIEGPANLNCTKRPSQTLHRPEQLKRRKCTGLEACEINGEKIVGDPQLKQEDVTDGSVKDGDLIEILIQSEECGSLKEKSPESLDGPLNGFGGREREQKIMLGFSKAIWKVLKEYNEKLKVAQNEICSLKYDLANERRRCSDLENALENMKSVCLCRIDPLEFKVKILSDMKGYQSVKLQEASLEAAASSVQGSEHTEHGHRADPTERSADMVIALDAEIEISEGCCHQNVNQQFGNLSQNISDAEDMGEEGIHSKSEASVTSTHSCLSPSWRCERAAESSSTENAEDLKDKGEEDIYVGNEETGGSSVSGPFTHQRCEDSGYSEDLINLTAVSRDYTHYEDKMTSGDVTNQTELERECSHLGSKLADIAVSSSNTPNIVRENCALSAGEQEFSSSALPESIVSSSPSPHINRDYKPFPAEDKLEVEAGEDNLVPLVTVMPTKDSACVRECDDGNTVVAHRVPSSKESQDMAKPKRRLLPASSLLLKDLNSLVIADEIDKPKAAREKKVAPDGRSKTQSNTSLLHLLKRNIMQ